jgi:hypothetical protein
MSEAQAEKFFDQLEKDKALQAKIKLGLETLAKIAADYDVTEDELNEELRKRWQSVQGVQGNVVYSEPPGF